jgi:hypothetical protein
MGGLVSTLGGLVDRVLGSKEDAMRATSDPSARHDTLAEGGLPTKISLYRRQIEDRAKALLERRTLAGNEVGEQTCVTGCGAGEAKGQDRWEHGRAQIKAKAGYTVPR